MIADPHCHTLASDGMVTAHELVEAAAAARLDLIAITDHDTMAEALGQHSGVTVVPGEEITTRWPGQTHIVGWFLREPVRSGMSIEDTVAAIHDQGGLAVIPHPFMPTYFGSIQPAMLRRLIEKHPIDAIEMMSTVPTGARRRRQLDEFYAANRERLGAAVGSSDCHFGAHDIGVVVTRYEGDFRTAVERRTTSPARLRDRNVPAGAAVRQQWRSLVQLPLRRLSGQL
ncbi:MAG TPA: PHP domain-containing protein [Candidatus Dormibacteraeota bacterium]|nr:PHP domain-containing protein [Candidatus Dormibacteraeota bacterium]